MSVVCRPFGSGGPLGSPIIIFRLLLDLVSTYIGFWEVVLRTRLLEWFCVATSHSKLVHTVQLLPGRGPSSSSNRNVERDRPRAGIFLDPGMQPERPLSAG